jgi:2,3-bisphosphoglycerate-dependent phosphoglycerate mutase
MSGQRTTDLLLVRHGLPVSGTADPGLSETGQRQARTVAAWIAAEPVDALFSSPLRRARETAAPLADLVGRPATIVPDLREWGSDDAIYTAPEEIDPADPQAIALAEGRYEDFLPKIDVPAFRARAHSAVTALLDQADGGRIVAFSHGGLINAALATLLGTPLTFWFNPGYTSICRVRRLPSGATVLCAVNETAHLRSGPPAREPVVGWENLGGFRLDPTDEADLLDRQTECTLIWSDGTGHPLGAVVNYLVRDGRFWLTATDRRPRVAAIRRDPRVSIAISSRGSGIPHRRSLTVRGQARVHDDDDVKAWFLPALAERMRPGDGERQIAFARHLDSPGRVVIEVVPERLIGFDGTKMWATAPEAAPVEADDRHAISGSTERPAYSL